MRRRTVGWWVGALLLAAALTWGGAPAVGNGVQLVWSAVSGGAHVAQSTAGGVRLIGTLGQPATTTLSGSGVTLAGGYWTPGTQTVPTAVGALAADAARVGPPAALLVAALAALLLTPRVGALALAGKILRGSQRGQSDR